METVFLTVGLLGFGWLAACVVYQVFKVIQRRSKGSDGEKHTVNWIEPKDTDGDEHEK